MLIASNADLNMPERWTTADTAMDMLLGQSEK